MAAPPQPYPGIGVKAPLVPPIPGQIIVGYQIIEPETGCCKCENLTGGGMALLIIGILFFWPIAIIPCCTASFKHKTQVPIYGYPGQGMPPAAGLPYGGVPYQGVPVQAPQYNVVPPPSDPNYPPKY